MKPKEAERKLKQYYPRVYEKIQYLMGTGLIEEWEDRIKEVVSIYYSYSVLNDLINPIVVAFIGQRKEPERVQGSLRNNRENYEERNGVKSHTVPKSRPAADSYNITCRINLK